MEACSVSGVEQRKRFARHLVQNRTTSNRLPALVACLGIRSAFAVEIFGSWSDDGTSSRSGSHARQRSSEVSL